MLEPSEPGSVLAWFSWGKSDESFRVLLDSGPKWGRKLLLWEAIESAVV